MFGIPAVELVNVVATDTQEATDTLWCSSPGSPFSFAEAGGGWAFCFVWNVKRCKEEQLFFSALCSFIRKKESIHIFSYMHLAAFRLLAHLSSCRGGTALQQHRLASFQGQKCKLFILH